MADVRITVNGQKYTIRVDDGDEKQLEQLVAYFNNHVDRLAEELGHIAESRLLILAGIKICEELFEARGTELADAHAALAREIEQAAERIEHCAARISGGSPLSGA